MAEASRCSAGSCNDQFAGSSKSNRISTVIELSTGLLNPTDVTEGIKRCKEDIATTASGKSVAGE
jgi:hypothetical protein